MYQHPKAAPLRVTEATDSTGRAFNPESMNQTFGRDASGSVTSIVAADGADTWTQTITRDPLGNVSSVSAWVKS